MKFTSDVDIDFADRRLILDQIKHVPASIHDHGSVVKHNTGIYVTDIPVNPLTGTASIDYKTAGSRGYIKLDFLNVNIYKQIASEKHLVELMQIEPPWHRLYDESFCTRLIHIGKHYSTVLLQPEKINSIPRLAMFLAIIRPGKKHLIGRSWDEISQSVWKVTQTGYQFKKSHSICYAHLVVVHMNLLELFDQSNATSL